MNYHKLLTRQCLSVLIILAYAWMFAAAARADEQVPAFVRVPVFS